MRIPWPLWFLFAAPLLAQSPQKVDGKRAHQNVEILASDAFGGRKSGLESGRRAEEWVAERLAGYGLEPGANGSWFHELKATVTEELPAPRFEARSKKRPPHAAAYLKDYVTLIYSGEGTVEAPVVFAGFGIHAPEQGRDDYEGLDVNGKLVIALRGMPAGWPVPEHRFIGYKSSTAADRGAAGFLLVEGDRAIPGTIQEKYFREKLPAVWLGRETADDLFARAGKPPLATQAEALKRGERNSYELEGVTARLEIHAKLHKDAVMRNVVGLWPGDTDEYVVLGAHLDHLGTDGAGHVYNGADDNASGSGMLLEVARAVAASGRHFRRNLLFVWFAGEEQGLLGSNAFVKDPPVPLEKIAVMINTDMVGQGKPVLAVGGPPQFPRDAGALGDFRVDGIEAKPGRGGGGSDHLPFMLAGIPAFFVHTQGKHPNYHTPEDDAAAIRPGLLELAGRFVRAIAERAAKADASFCRPMRKAEYLWHAATWPDLYTQAGKRATPGIDLYVRWFAGDFNALDAELTRLEADGAPAKLLRPGQDPEAELRGIEPVELLGLEGPAATRLHRPAHRLGVGVFAPFVDAELFTDTADLFALARKKPLLIDLRNAPEEFDVTAIPAPILVPRERAETWRKMLAARKAPWLVVYPLAPLVENKPAVHAEIGAEILALRGRVGKGHLVVVPADSASATFAAQAPTLIPGVVGFLAGKGLEGEEIRALLGGNLVRVLGGLARKR